ncbi:MAG: alpha/beta fold hydrolase [Propionibacteriaceae bacterium]|nr:alpha/beta fold hydrolase [Propionibacteriaceae bacterium]
MSDKHSGRSVGRIVARVALVTGSVILGILMIAGVLLGTPVLDPSLTSSASPVAAYTDAVARIDAVATQESDLPLLPRAHSYALLTGQTTPTAVVIFHGYCNTPDEFRLVAQAYRDQGDNVWVPRLPHHGLADKFTDEFSQLTAEELRDFADDQIDIAAGLGEKVLVMGLSGGGSVALWTGLERPEVTRTVLISPMLQPIGYSEWAVPPIVRALRLSPVDSYAWYNAEKQADNVEGMIYPRYSLKGVAAILGMRIWAQSKTGGTETPMQASVLLIRNDGDQTVDADFNQNLLTQLTAPDGLEVYRIPASAGLLHDLIAPDPEFNTDAQVTESYGQLEQALGIPMPDPLQTR